MAKRKVKAEVTRDREFRAFAELSHAHWVIVENAKSKRDGWFYECLTANVLAAFKIEAFLNHLGAKLFENWEQYERRASKRKKLERILTELKVPRRPSDQRFDTLEAVFRFRDAVAHARTEFLKQDVSIEEGEMEDVRRNKPLTEWETLCTVEFSVKAYECTESIISEIYAASNFDPSDLRRSGHAYSIRVIEKY